MNQRRLPPPPPDLCKGWRRIDDWKPLARDSNIFYLDWEESNGHKVCVTTAEEGFDWRSINPRTRFPFSTPETWYGNGHESTLDKALDAANASLQSHLQD